VGPGFEEDILPRARQLESRLASARPEDEAEAAQLRFEVQELLAEHRAALTYARSFAARRGSHAANPVLLSADRVVDTLGGALSSFATRNGLELELGPPLALIEESARAERTRATFGPAAIVLPSRTLAQPWRFRTLGRGMGEYLIAAVPGLQAEVLEAIEPLRPTGSDRDPDSVARFLAAGWVADLLPDLLGASILGPAYLRALAYELRSPGRPDSVAAVPVDNRGYAPTLPHHLRMHAVASWLDALGERERVAATLGTWDEEHGALPEMFLTGPTAHGRLPLEPARLFLAEAVRLIYGIELTSLAGRGLAEIPDLTDWSTISRSAETARASWSAGEPTDAGPRAILAAAIEGALEGGERPESIQARLADALSGRRPRRPRGLREAAPAPDRSEPGHIGTQEIVEALLLEDVLLRRRA
jgi:hypothetical protein